MVGVVAHQYFEINANEAYERFNYKREILRMLQYNLQHNKELPHKIPHSWINSSLIATEHVKDLCQGS